MYLPATYSGERLGEILLRENADPGEMLVWERKEQSLSQTEKLSACSSFLIWWRWRARTSIWPSLLSVFNSFVFWDHLLQKLNCNPQSKLCRLYFCESGQNAEGQSNVDLFLLSSFCIQRNHTRFCICTGWEGIWAGLYTQNSGEVVAGAFGTAQLLVQLLCDLLHTGTSELPVWFRQMKYLGSSNYQIIQKGARKPVLHCGRITCSQETFSFWLNEVNDHLMPDSIKVYSPLSNIDDDSVVAINALLFFSLFNCFFTFFNTQF